MVSAPVTWHRFDPGTFGIGSEALPLDEQTTIGLYMPRLRTALEILV